MYKTKITVAQWKRYKTEYRKWYKNHFGENRSQIITSLDYTQLVSYIQAHILTNMPTSGIVEIIGKNGTEQEIHYIVNCL